MNYKRFLAGILVFSFLLSVAGCSIPSGKNKARKVRHDDDDDFWETLAETVATVMTEPTETEPTDTYPTQTDPTIGYDDEIIDLDMLICKYGQEINDKNTIQEIIAQKTGVRLHESWLSGITEGEAVGTIVASGQYPDLIYGGDSFHVLYENDLLVAWDPYLEMYPALKEMYSDVEWDAFRASDGHIYWADVLNNHYNDVDISPDHVGQAFWIQTRVLEWAGYPEIETLDQYFDLIESYCEANPTMPDGTPNIGYTALCDSWYYFGIENPPMFLDGYPNDGCCIVNDDDPSNPYVIDYNTTDTAKRYFSKLNEMYNKGLMDPDFFDQNHDQYIAKLKTGAVLGMCDGYWSFGYDLDPYFSTVKLSTGETYYEAGCGYVPLGLTIDPGMENRWHDYGDTLNTAEGIAVFYYSWVEPEIVFGFLSDLLDQDIHDLRFWGIEGEDYLVDENGLYYRTTEMRQLWSDPYYKADHCCLYSFCPQWMGISRDGKNAMMPSEQPEEVMAAYPRTISDCLKAYGVNSYAEMIGSVRGDIRPWYPLWSWSNMLTTNTPEGMVWSKMGEYKHQWIPIIIMSKDFDSDWDSYMKDYKACSPEDFFDAAQMEVDIRMELSGY